MNFVFFAIQKKKICGMKKGTFERYRSENRSKKTIQMIVQCLSLGAFFQGQDQAVEFQGILRLFAPCSLFTYLSVQKNRRAAQKQKQRS